MGNICNVEPLQAQGTVVVDSAQSISSENPLQNKVVTVEKANASALCVDLSGNPITFEADSQAVQKLVVTLEPIQEGSGTPSPENVRPISGRTGTGVVANGENMLRSGEAKTYTENGITFTSDGKGTYTVKGTSTAYASCNFACDEYTTPKGSETTVIYNNTQANSSVSFAFFNGNTQIDSTGMSVVNRAYSGFVAVSEKVVNKYQIQVSSGQTVNMTIQPMFARGNVASNPPSFVPYKTPVSCSMTFGQTVYGGTVDFKTGKVTVDKAFETFTGAESESWVLSTGSGYHQYNIACPSSKNSVNAIANEFQKISISERGQKTGFLSYADDTSFHFALKDSELYIANVSAWKTWLASNNLQVCYELAIPIELQLTSSELELLEGYNYITADGNMNISLVPENVIDYVMGQIISAMGTNESGRTTASRAYTTGEYFYKDGKMYKALTSIASGATFTVGTNCTQTTIFAELKNAQN